MPEIIATTVYAFDELSDTAQEAARAWYRDGQPDDDWHEFVFKDFETICLLLGITLTTRPVRLMGGGTRQKPCIWFRGFWSQGDGANFEGRYAPAAGAAKAIRSHAPQDEKLHRIANALQAVQRRNFYQLRAKIAQQGHYCHEYSMAISIERDSPTGQGATADAEDTVIEALRDLARWLYHQLEREYKYQTSNTMVDEAIRANDYANHRP